MAEVETKSSQFSLLVSPPFPQGHMSDIEHAHLRTESPVLQWLHLRKYSKEISSARDRNNFISLAVCKGSAVNRERQTGNTQYKKWKLEAFYFYVECFMTSRFGMYHLPAAYAWILLNQ